MRPIRILICLATLVCVAQAASAGAVLAPDREAAACQAKGLEVGKRGSAPVPRERIDRPLDVRLYELDLRLFADSDSIEGDVQIAFAPTTSTLTTAEFDLSNDGMTVDAVWLDGVSATYTHANELVSVSLPGGLNVGEEAIVRVLYRGRPADELYGLSSFPGGYRYALLAGADGRADPQAPVLASLSEPTAARAWWPCHDTPYDAAQVRLRVTGPAQMELASAGVQELRVDHGDGTATTTWFMPIPISPYLVSIAMADYEVWSESATVTSLDTGSPIPMPVQYFANTARRPHAEYSWQNTVEMIEYFDGLISPYPYGDLKYGHALFTFPGAMEHPTVTSMGSLTASLSQSSIHSGPRADWIVAHELIHQWYGDSLRLTRWGEIWLNEGFASYGEILWLEHKYGYDVAKTWLLDDKLFDFYPGTVRDPDPSRGLFSSTIYDKGAWILHMLRQVLGRDGLIESMRRFAERHRFAPVTTEDFVAICDEVELEQGGAQLVNGSLSWFFEQWLDREDRPSLVFDWLQTASGSTVLRVRQPGEIYRLPLIARIDYGDGTSEDFTVAIDGADFTIELATSKAVRRLALDPENDWLLRKSTDTSSPPSLASLLPPVPNPFNPRVALRFFLAEPARVTLRIYDARGRVVRTLLDELQPSDLSQVNWDGSDDSGAQLASGVYVVRLTSSNGVEQSQRVTLLK